MQSQITLSQKQQQAFDLYRAGKNIFLTGPGGTGKSALIKRIYDDVMQRNKDNINMGCDDDIIHMSVTALTGCAAELLNCNGRTLHSWAGIGIGTATQETLINKITNNKFKRDMWCATDILVIDEVSMLSEKLFNLIDAIAKGVRKRKEPFGGIQVILSGDFFQLPPVGNSSDPSSCKFCFESSNWNKTFRYAEHICLDKLFRQSGDETYKNILQQLRTGVIKRRTIDILNGRVNHPIDTSLAIEPTKLYPVRNKVIALNTRKLAELDDGAYPYPIRKIYDLPMTPDEQRERTQLNATPAMIEYELDYLLKNTRCDENMTLKIGAHVMCIVNIKNSNDEMILVNGSQGIITGYDHEGGILNPIVRFNNGITRAMEPHNWKSESIPGIGISQVPLILAWALTIHKCQGVTLDAAEVDAGSSVFACGQIYVALSRVKTLSGLYLSEFSVEGVRVNSNVKEFYATLDAHIKHEAEEDAKVRVTTCADPLVLLQLSTLDRQHIHTQKIADRRQQQAKLDMNKQFRELERQRTCKLAQQHIHKKQKQTCLTMNKQEQNVFLSFKLPPTTPASKNDDA